MRAGRLVLAAVLGVVCAVALGVYFAPTAPPPEDAMRARLERWSPDVPPLQVSRAPGSSADPSSDPMGERTNDPSDDPSDLREPELGPVPDTNLDDILGWAAVLSGYSVKVEAEMKRRCGADLECLALGIWSVAVDAENPDIASSLRSDAITIARRSGNLELWRDMKLVHGTGIRERHTDRRMVQAWGRVLADRAPAMQQQLVEAAVLVTPDSPLHEPLAILGGYPACTVDKQLGWVACASH